MTVNLRALKACIGFVEKWEDIDMHIEDKTMAINVARTVAVLVGVALTLICLSMIVA